MPSADTATPFHPAALAQALQTATATGHVIDAASWPASLEAADIIAVHRERAQRWGDAAQAPQYWKSGGPSRSQPLGHAPLPPQGVHGDGADLRATPFFLRGIEAEIALRLGQSVDADQAAALDEAGAARLIDAMAVSIEIVDARWRQQLQAPAALKAADLLCHGALVLGEWQPYRPVDGALQPCTVQIGTQPAQAFENRYGLQDPAWLLPQFLRYVSEHFGALRAGTVVTTGSWCGLLQAAPGDAVRVQFEGIGALRVQL
jgi:2-keto-4-pentenoate hydratase